MYILLDLVVKTTVLMVSEWFQKACEDPDGKYGNFFYITDKKEGELVMQSCSYFGGPVRGNSKLHPDNSICIVYRKQPI